jgi:hypothetical protein
MPHDEMPVKMHNTDTLSHLIRVEHSAAPNEPKHTNPTDADRYQSQDPATHGL